VLAALIDQQILSFEVGVDNPKLDPQSI